MPTLIPAPTIIHAVGNKPKRIEDYAGLQEITLVLRGTLRVEHDGGSVDVSAGQAIVTRPGEWVRYASPAPGGAEYVAVCLPAFSPDTVHRDAVS
jgi:mannose-6-phosphate isomerase-like protein (cupin superfamily)